MRARATAASTKSNVDSTLMASILPDLTCEEMRWRHYHGDRRGAATHPLTARSGIRRHHRCLHVIQTVAARRPAVTISERLEIVNNMVALPAQELAGAAGGRQHLLHI
ncbi:hypothetical protein GCM10010170_080720 [Dactylosporangium salmoneum]|uniref:Uncharacterized protein n=1 Tax=Dactylosporangium salmoneum TaxID=53361 RepID=A0ABP5UCC0_9ACTN